MAEQTKTVKQRKLTPRVAGTVPFSPEVARAHLLERAGFDEHRQIDLIKKTIGSIERDLNAEKTMVIVTHNGRAIRETVADNVARARARDHAMDLTGIRAPRTNAAQVVRHVVSIEWPDFARPEPTTIEAKADVVE